MKPLAERTSELKQSNIRAITLINAGATALAIVLSLWLIPLYGAVGAAAAITATVAAHNLLVHAGLLLGTGVDLFQARFLKVYGTICVAFVVLWAVRSAGPTCRRVVDRGLRPGQYPAARALRVVGAHGSAGVPGLRAGPGAVDGAPRGLGRTQ